MIKVNYIKESGATKPIETLLELINKQDYNAGLETFNTTSELLDDYIENLCYKYESIDYIYKNRDGNTKDLYVKYRNDVYNYVNSVVAPYVMEKYKNSTGLGDRTYTMLDHNNQHMDSLGDEYLEYLLEDEDKYEIFCDEYYAENGRPYDDDYDYETAELNRDYNDSRI